MRRQDAVFVALCVSTIVFAIAFVYPGFTPESVGWYYPLEHRWALEVKPNGLALDFYGRTLQAAIAWSLGFIVTLAIAKRLRAIGARMLALFAGWAVTAIVFVMCFYGWTLYHRVPVPAPTPSWYQPR